MRRAGGAGLGGVVLALVLAMALSGSAGAQAKSHHVGRTAARGHLQVIEVEYRLMLSRGAVKAGLVSLQAIDRGMDPHDLRLRAVGSKRELTAPRLTAEQSWGGVVRLKPGIYRLWCSLPEHAKLGMRATLRVVR
ncbi:MAG TPA: hypothetical protein VFY36_03085 [Solirubrobacteraceae bacterium]|nr:hypothetical protein [Solirubrobacteraceae bacterium]